jgi:hypothetical protein
MERVLDYFDTPMQSQESSQERGGKISVKSRQYPMEQEVGNVRERACKPRSVGNLWKLNKTQGWSSPPEGAQSAETLIFHFHLQNQELIS